MATTAQLDSWFSYHAPRPDQLPKYAKIRAAARAFADVLNTEVPDGDEKEMAILCVREASMLANAGIACYQPGQENIGNYIFDSLGHRHRRHVGTRRN